MKRGPEEAKAGSLYIVAHQAYWGFRYLHEHRAPLWLAIENATSVLDIQKIGRTCAAPNAMPGAGYGASGAMTYLARDHVAREILAAKKHHQYPKSKRPSSDDRRMIFLGVAIAAGLFERSIGTALRKLTEDGLGLEHIAEDVHQFDRFREKVIVESLIWAEPVGNYFSPSSSGRWRRIRELPCEIPDDWQGGFIIHGHTRLGPKATFARGLPIGLKGESQSREDAIPVRPQVGIPNASSVSISPNVVVCRCGATIASPNRRTALKFLAKHIRDIHGMSYRRCKKRKDNPRPESKPKC